MNKKLASLARAQGGVILSHQALANGMSADDLRGLVLRAEWLVLRKGVFVEAAVVEAADALPGPSTSSAPGGAAARRGTGSGCAPPRSPTTMSCGWRRYP